MDEALVLQVVPFVEFGLRKLVLVLLAVENPPWPTARDATLARRAGGTGIVVTVDVEHADPPAAASDTVTWAVQLADGNVEVVDVRVCTPGIYESETFRPDTPNLVAASDVAEVLGVSRQRVHQLARDHPQFPAPYVRLGSGPIWSRPAVEHFDRLWTCKPGRPARAS